MSFEMRKILMKLTAIITPLLGFILVLLCLFAQNAVAVRGQDAMPSTCEYVKHALDYSIVEGREDESAYVILVFRRGTREKPTALLNSRKQFVSKYLNFRDPQFNRFIIAESDPTGKLGRLDIYIGGKPKWQVFFKRNKLGWKGCVE
jgi:hypothetical protein